MENCNNPIRIGIIGCGAIAFRKHLPAIAARRDMVVSALCDENQQRATKACEQFGQGGAAVFADSGALIHCGKVDAVCICTPNALHARQSIEALEAGLHVICEKPMAASYTDAKRMAESAEKSGKILYVAYQNRYTDEAMFLKRLCDDGYLGSVYHIKAHAVRTRAVPAWGASLNLPLQGGGPLIDIGSHVIDLAMWLTDNYHPRYLSCMTYRHLAQHGSAANRWGDWDKEAFEAEDSAFGLVVMQDGMTIELSAAWAMNTVDEREGKVSLYGDRAGAEMLDRLVVTQELGGKICNTYPVLGTNPRPLAPDSKEQTAGDREMEVFVRAVRQGRHREENGRQALVTARIIEGMYRSAQTKEPVYFEDIT